MKTPNRLLLMVCIIGFCGCGEYEILEHNKRVTKKVDSLYRIKRDSLQSHADSICSLIRDSYFEHAKDSISNIRIKEIEQLIEQ